MAKQLETELEFKELTEGEGVVVVDFFATWCGPCKMLLPVFDSVSNDYEGKATFIKVDVDQFPDLAAANNVKGVPSVHFFKDGVLQEISKGYKPAEALGKLVDSYLVEE